MALFSGYYFVPFNSLLLIKEILVAVVYFPSDIKLYFDWSYFARKLQICASYHPKSYNGFLLITSAGEVHQNLTQKSTRPCLTEERHFIILSCFVVVVSSFQLLNGLQWNRVPSILPMRTKSQGNEVILSTYYHPNLIRTIPLLIEFL